MSKLLKVNVRGQVSLGSLAQYEMYEAIQLDNGQILLRPVVVIALDKLPKVDE